MKEKDAHFKALLREAGFRATPGRIALLLALAEVEKPLTVAALHARVKKNLDPVTLYRALESLAKKGIVKRVDFRHGHAHYELQQRHHHHLVCTDCGVVEDVEICPAEKLETQVVKGSRRFKSIYSHNLEFFGRCKACA